LSEDSGKYPALAHDWAEKWLKMRVLENLRFDKSDGNPRRYWTWRVFGQALSKLQGLTTQSSTDWIGISLITVFGIGVGVGVS